ncbi:carboxypeptidase-like regulatory domain-containing protein [Pedobacter nutrimenti]|uniref:carboxypeptidase-like regulatory domain-containing protein n=1 Tax=Pedobacter nutrimenti TaxID=1241337 RepID=UPI00292FF577|nr:carboxypeptidase-like regulatory domain-containing protein [Pedobacter nutrimenti]
MKFSFYHLPFFFLLLTTLTGLHLTATAQSLLHRTISVRSQNQPLGKVMTQIEEKAGLLFSYQSKIIPQDSLVNFQCTELSINEVLDKLLDERYDYSETRNFIILRYAPKRLSLVLDKAWGDQEKYTIKGYVIDEHTRQKIRDASVYERNLAQATLTDENGYFEISLSHINQPIALRISKENYKELTTYYLLEVKIQPSGKTIRTEEISEDPGDLITNGLAQFLISSKQRIHALNLGNMISTAPYQASLTPAINTHGNFSGQIVNEISLNVIGGYSAGVDGVEVGGIFNLNKMNMRGVQLAGIFNINGGKADGLQLAGVYNDVKGSRTGVQLAGIFNTVHGKSSGLQMSGILNQADQLSGFQFGLINVAHSSTGYSLGLLNLISNGFQRINISTNETTTLNLALKTGNNNLYTSLLGGMNLKKEEKQYLFGAGLGKVINMGKMLSLSPELSCRYLYLGNWKDINLLNRFDLDLNFRLTNGLRITTGPSLNIYYSDQVALNPGYADMIQRKDQFNLSNPKLKGWIGWTAGFTIF